jgi:hypothetical protein
MCTQCAPLAWLAQNGSGMGDGHIQGLHRALPGFGGKVRIPQGHLDGGMPHQLLDDLEGHAPHRQVAAVGVAQVVPGDGALFPGFTARVSRYSVMLAVRGWPPGWQNT